MKGSQCIVAGLLGVLLHGCVIEKPASPGDGRYAPVAPDMPAVPPSHPGSLYNPVTNVSLFSDRKANRVGDILFITLKETTAATKLQTTSVKKDNSVSLPVPNVFGNPLGIRSTDASAMAAAQNREFKGDTSSDQSNTLQGNISVTVTKVYPNGNLFVSGEKWFKLSTGDEMIRISGMIRPEDVAPDNTIASNRLADARITYSGEGQLADANRMGWLTRFFNSEYWPF